MLREDTATATLNRPIISSNKAMLSTGGIAVEQGTLILNGSYEDIFGPSPSYFGLSSHV